MPFDIWDKWNSSRPKKTHCPKGHAYTAENTYIWMRNGREERQCRTCLHARYGLLPNSGEGLITDEDRKKLRKLRYRRTPKTVSAIKKFNEFRTKFKPGFSHPKDPVSDALFTIAKNNFIREGRVR